MRDIHFLLYGCVVFDIKHIYYEANSVTNWVASFVAHHSGASFWDDLSFLPMSFKDIFLMIFWVVFILLVYKTSV